MGPLEVEFDDNRDPREYTCGTLDITAAARDLGWRPRIDLPSGITAYAQFLRGASG
jgi:nucleoside-diphosphate-sugar epimerase